MPSHEPDKSVHLDRYLLTTNVLDQLFRVPGTRWRFGLDAIFGLVPIAGDVVTALIGAYGMVVAQQLGVPVAIQMRMLVNLLIDAGVGTIPLLGDCSISHSRRTCVTRVCSRNGSAGLTPHVARASWCCWPCSRC